MARPSEDVIPPLTFSIPGDGSDRASDPNKWFAERFPEAVERYGPAFMVGSWTDPFQQTHVIPAHLNTDFFAGVLGGDPRLGHQVVYHSQEARWYYYDPMVDAFVPTTEAKLELLLSNQLIQCSQSCGRLVDVRPLVVTFREPKSLQVVIERGKAMLQADSLFFKGEEGKRRFVDGRFIEPTEDDSYRQFVKQAVVADSRASLVVADAFDQYRVFCSKNQLPALQRPEFKALVAEVIREEFHLGIRHDIDNGRGKISQGWRGLSLVEPLADFRNN